MSNQHRQSINNYNMLAVDSSIRVGQITKINYPGGLMGGTAIVTYDLLAFDDKGGTFKVFRARLLSDLSSLNDFEETILEANEVAVEGKRLDASTEPKFMNGSYVVIAFINSDRKNAVILGGLQHPKVKSEAKEGTGRTSTRERNGLRTKINKDGELEITFKGAKTPDGRPKSLTQKPIVFKIGNKDEVETKNAFTFKMIAGSDELIGFETPNKQHVMIDDKAGTIELLQKDGTKILLDGDIQIEHNNGSFITINDNTLIEHNSGSKVELSSSGDVTVQKSDSQKVTISGSDLVAESNGGKLKLTSGKVGLGTSAVEVLDKSTVVIEKTVGIVDEFINNAATIVNTAVGPGALNPAVVVALGLIKTELTAVKTALDGIKTSV